MNILQYFHKSKTMSPFKVGDQVKLIEDWERIRNLYNSEYPNCAMSEDKFKEAVESSVGHLRSGFHKVSKITEGTPAAGGYFVYIDGKDVGYHGNIFELVK
jgi:hypothetical protein